MKKPGILKGIKVFLHSEMMCKVVNLLKSSGAAAIDISLLYAQITEDDEDVEQAHISAMTSPLLAASQRARTGAYTTEAELMPLHQESQYWRERSH